MGFWVPATLAGGTAAEIVRRCKPPVRPSLVFGGLAAFVVASSVAWFYINLSAVPPYIPGATMDPTYAPPEAVRGLAIVTTALVLPGSAIACWLAFRWRTRSRVRTTAH